MTNVNYNAWKAVRLFGLNFSSELWRITESVNYHYPTCVYTCVCVVSGDCSWTRYWEVLPGRGFATGVCSWHKLSWSCPTGCHHHRPRPPAGRCSRHWQPGRNLPVSLCAKEACQTCDCCHLRRSRHSKLPSPCKLESYIHTSLLQVNYFDITPVEAVWIDSLSWPTRTIAIGHTRRQNAGSQQHRISIFSLQRNTLSIILFLLQLQMTDLQHQDSPNSSFC